jgi:hypothetical protein
MCTARRWTGVYKKFIFNFSANNIAPTGLICFPEYDDFSIYSISASQEHFRYEDLSLSLIIQNSQDYSDLQFLTNNAKQ